jgi:hypothetical protein
MLGLQQWEGIDWGTAPAWASSVLSGASLLLALAILVRDRKEKRRESADKLTSWSTVEAAHDDDVDGPGYEYVLHVNIYNANDAPLPYAVLHGTADGANRIEAWFNDTNRGAPGPIGERTGYRVSEGFWQPPRLDQLVIIFSDLAGRERIRHLQTGRYLTAREARNRRREIRRRSRR